MKSKSKEKALEIAKLISSKKAKDIVVLEVKGISSLCDYFVICSGESGREVNALSEYVRTSYKKEKSMVDHFEKDSDSKWILVDCIDVILHIFLDEVREFYNLEYLWPDAKKIKLPKHISS